MGDEEGVESILELLLGQAKKGGGPGVAAAAARLLAAYIPAAKVDLAEEFGELLVEGFLNLYTAKEEAVVTSAIHGPALPRPF